MAAVLLVLADVDLDIVLYTTRTTLVLGGRLDGDRGRRLLRHLEGEGVRVSPQLLDEPLLQLSGLVILRWVDLL